jgi:predicted lipoprotein with Yx(FWY)xxD motif
VLRRPTTVGAAALIVSALTFAACGAGRGNPTVLSSPPTTDNSLTLIVEHTADGSFLATGAGDTLYDFVPDTAQKSACLNDGCVFQWPPLIKTGPITLGPGLQQSLVGTLRRPDGSTQISYGGHPLYTYNLDVTRGDVTGQAIDQNGGLWYVVAPNGQQITKGFSISS